MTQMIKHVSQSHDATLGQKCLGPFESGLCLGVAEALADQL